MCGLVGMVDFERGIDDEDRRRLLAMNQRLAHRGPDDEGWFYAEQVALGHKRLAVIDLADGTQPMHSPDGNLVLVYNGEVYNFRELRKELEALGQVFRTHSDTEVVLRAFQEWGGDCVQRCNGDFAFAIWDRTRQELFLARDRLGVKPLYYTWLGSCLLFASELKALLAHPGVSRLIDGQALVESLAYFQPLNPATLLKQVKTLEPGHYLVINRTGITKTRYWSLSYRGCSDSPEQIREQVAWLLEDATRLRMVSDVPICGLLSGGLDSSILCTLMSRLAGTPINTFSLDFETNRQGPGRAGTTHIIDDDLDCAAQVAREIGAVHHPILVSDRDYFESLAAAARARDLPVALGSEVGIEKLCRSIKPQATVGLSGEGADEVCLGYYMFVHRKALEGGLKPFFVVPANRFMFSLHPRFRRRYQPLQHIEERFRAFLDSLPVLWEHERDRNLNTLHYLQIHHVLPYLLDRADRLSMAASVELRVPFCDHRFVEYYFNIPAQMKFREGIEKAVLRESFRGRVSGRVIDRKKSIFPYPYGQAQMATLYRATLDALKNPPDSRIARLYHGPLLRLVVLLARCGLVPTIGAHFICTFALTLEDLCRRYDLELAL